MASKAKQIKKTKKAKRDKAKPVGHSQVILMEMDDDDPDFDTSYERNKDGNTPKIRVVRNVRESPAALWYNKHKWIDEPQLLAADKFRRTWEMAGGRGVSAIDYAKDIVDGGPALDPINDRQFDANQELTEIRRALGPEGYDVIEKTCGQLMFLKQIDPRRRTQDKLKGIVISMLELLAHHYGYKTRPVRKYRGVAA